MLDESYIERFINKLKQECPKCGSSDIDVDWKDGENEEVIVENICESCNEEWAQRYKLVEEYIRSEDKVS